MRSRFPPYLLLITMVLSVSGCTLVGMGGGMMLSSRHEGWKSPSDLNTFQSGTRVVVHNQKGVSFEGIFAGTELEPLPAYQERYGAWMNTQASLQPLPYPGRPISVTSQSGAVVAGSFRGFDPGVMYIKQGESLLQLPIHQISSITMIDGSICDAAPLHQMTQADGFPYRTRLILQNNSGIMYLPVHPAQQVRTASPRYTYIGMYVGLAADLVLLSITVLR